MTFTTLIFRVHAIQRMFERRISKEDVRHVLATGEVIEEYPNDTPHPSRLILGWRKSQPLHVVVADDPDLQQTIVITVYEPDPSKWDSSFRRRTKP
jgi:hypothetical protein